MMTEARRCKRLLGDSSARKFFLAETGIRCGNAIQCSLSNRQTEKGKTLVASCGALEHEI
jgi:hypothetical protein